MMLEFHISTLILMGIICIIIGIWWGSSIEVLIQCDATYRFKTMP